MPCKPNYFDRLDFRGNATQKRQRVRPKTFPPLILPTSAPWCSKVKLIIFGETFREAKSKSVLGILSATVERSIVLNCCCVCLSDCAYPSTQGFCDVDDDNRREPEGEIKNYQASDSFVYILAELKDHHRLILSLCSPTISRFALPPFLVQDTFDVFLLFVSFRTFLRPVSMAASTTTSSHYHRRRLACKSNLVAATRVCKASTHTHAANIDHRKGRKR